MSSPTLALIQKDRPWLLGFLALGALLAGGFFLAQGTPAMFVYLWERQYEDLSFFLWVPALLFGAATVLRESLSRTEDFLRHRPVSPTRIYWTRTLSALVVLLLWVPLAAVAGLLVASLEPAGLAALDPRVVDGVVAVEAELAFAFALPVFALSLPAPWIWRLVVGATLWCAELLLLGLVSGDEAGLATLVIVRCSSALALLLAAAVAQRRLRDADLPVPASSQRWLAPVAVIGTLLLGLLVTSGVQRGALDGISGSRPRIVRWQGELVLAYPGVDGDGMHRVFDAQQRPTERRIPQGADLEWTGVPHPPGPETESLRSTIQRRESMNARRQGSDVCWFFLTRDDGRLEWVLIGPQQRQRGWLAKPDGRAFSGDSFLFETERDSKTAEFFAVDPEGGGPWKLTREVPPRLELALLPEGDRALGNPGRELGVLGGERSGWRWTGAGWESASFVPDVETSLETEVISDDALRPEILVRAPDGTFLGHRYTLASGRERLWAGMAMLMSTLRPLPSALIGASVDYATAHERSGAGRAWIFDPLMGGGYRWLLLPNVTLAAFLAWRTWRELGRRGLSQRRSAWWTVAVLVIGVFAFSACAALETRRAWRRPAKVEPASVRIRAA